MVSALDEPGDGHILVDWVAAWKYTMRLDGRVMDTAIWSMIEASDAKIAADPIGYAVGAARGGP